MVKYTLIGTVMSMLICGILCTDADAKSRGKVTVRVKHWCTSCPSGVTADYKREDLWSSWRPYTHDQKYKYVVWRVNPCNKTHIAMARIWRCGAYDDTPYRHNSKYETVPVNPSH